MHLTEFKNILNQSTALEILDANGERIPPHFHVTEIGKVDKHFMDCGGSIRTESRISLQLFIANDVHHRLGAAKLLSIINMAEKQLGLTNEVIEVEYQTDTIGKFDLHFDGVHLQLMSKATDCLAKETCGIAEKPKKRVRLKSLTPTACCDDASCC